MHLAVSDLCAWSSQHLFGVLCGHDATDCVSQLADLATIQPVRVVEGPEGITLDSLQYLRMDILFLSLWLLHVPKLI